MANCATCGSTILFGGVRDGDLRFCNNECHAKGYLFEIAAQIPEEEIRRQVQEVHAGPCPKCGGNGPVDVHNSYQVYSVLLMTSWKTNQLVACKSCGTKAKIGDLLFSTFLGWWGFPWGLFVTPVQIFRNLRALMISPDPYSPSDSLEQVVRLGVASAVAQTADQQAG